jgi:hypothetical protein
MAMQSRNAGGISDGALRRFLLYGIPLFTYAMFSLLHFFGGKELKDVIDFLTFRK